VQIHFIQRKQFNETNVTSHDFLQISNLKIFLNASVGHWKRCGGPYAAREPLAGPHWFNQTTLCCLLFTHCVACYVCRLVEIYIRFSLDFWVSKCKAVIVLASFDNASAQFFKPAWCSNIIKLSDSRPTYRFTSYRLKELCESV